MAIFERAIVETLRSRLMGGPNLIQLVMGPRQVGKTTAVQQVLSRWKGPSHYASADLPSPPDPSWIQTHWLAGRTKSHNSRLPTLLVLDEVQKVSRWGDVVKALHDDDRRTRARVRVVLLGSSSLHLRQGAHESLAGRFERHYCPHWSWPECRKAFRWNLERWIFYGGYPGSAPLLKSPSRWADYVAGSLIESVLSKDVLQMAPVSKPALLRQLFMLAVRMPARILSFNKMLGQLQDAGNTVTLAHYLELLSAAYLVSGLDQWAGNIVRQKASSPKLIVWNNALVNAIPGSDLVSLRGQPDEWGWLVENAVGGYLLNQCGKESVFYWRSGDQEVDYVVSRGRSLLAIEVKSGRRRPDHRGLAEFQKRHPTSKPLIVGSGGLDLETFFSTPPETWLH